MIELEIDGRTLTAPSGSTIIQVADGAGIYIPRFCYHKKLSVAANCRMCLVDVEKSPKTLPACATPIAPGMKVSTRSSKSLLSQKAVMEFLLANHPLDCPICDQGGECELQDLALGYGSGFSRFNVGKQSVHDQDLGPLIATEMTRCIECTRCIRFGDEIAGLRELGLLGRGETVSVGTYVAHFMNSEVSGNIIDLCPVGALTSKPFRFQARAWEMLQHPSIAPHDGWGSHIYVHTRGEEYCNVRNVMRVVSRECEDINETWISDRDRYSYSALNAETRLLRPEVKRDGVWQAVDWDVALDEAAMRLRAVLEESNPDQLAGLISPSATIEEMWLFQKLIRALGSPHIDHRLHQADVSDQIFWPQHPSLGGSISDLAEADAVFLIGAHPRRELPMAALRLRAAAKRGSIVSSISLLDSEEYVDPAHCCVLPASEWVSALLGVICALRPSGDDSSLRDLLEGVESSPIHIKIADSLKRATRPWILLGAAALNHPQAAVIRALAGQVAQILQARFGCLAEGANAAGAWLAGAVPHRLPGGMPVSSVGLDAWSVFASSRKAYCLFGVEPELDSANAQSALSALRAASVVIACSAFSDGFQRDYADILLPIAPFSENAGTYINLEGRWQSFSAVGPTRGLAKCGFEVLTSLAQSLGLDGFAYANSAHVLDALKAELANAAPFSPASTDLTSVELSLAFSQKEAPSLSRFPMWHLYLTDPLVRHAAPLQAALSERDLSVCVHPIVAKRLGLKEGNWVTAVQGSGRLTLPLRLDERLADRHVWLPSGLAQSAGFGDTVSPVELRAFSSTHSD